VAYALTLSNVSAIAQNCGTQLLCGERSPASFAAPGEVDSYRFDGTAGDTVRLEISESSDSLDGVELRIFDPEGLPVPESVVGSGCATSRAVVLPKSGVYTVLANPCFGSGTGAYTVGWFPRNCPPVTLLGRHSADDRMYIRTSADGRAVVEIGAARLSCGFSETSGFLVQPDPALAISGGRFAGQNLELPARALTLDIDGVLEDVDGDGLLDQAIGGLSAGKDGGRCNFQWAATALLDSDGDGWADLAEHDLGSDRYREGSTPENKSIGTTTLIGPGTCRDWYDNDGDGAADAGENACQPFEPAGLSRPSLFAGRHSDGEALWFRLADDGGAVLHLGSSSLGCGSVAEIRRDLPVNIAVAGNRFALVDYPLEGGGTLSLDGVLFDADGDEVTEHAVGGLSLRFGANQCRLKWWATAHVDSDNDGWSDHVERRFGSDALPLPLGKGTVSSPESDSVPSTILLGAALCEDGLDNDDDGLVDAEDVASCGAILATPTVTQMAIPTPTATAIVQPTHADTCAGDCNADGAVTVDELLRGVVIILGESDSTDCPAIDGNGDSAVTVDELLAAVNELLAGCPSLRR